METEIRIALYAAPALFLLMAVEFTAHYRDKDTRAQRAGVSVRDTLTSLSVMPFSIADILLGKFMFPLIVIAAALAPHTLPATAWWVWAAAIVLTDLGYYFEHRMCHRIRLFWASHSAHHNSQYFNLSTALRLPGLIPGSILTGAVYIPLALIGVPVWMIFISQTIGFAFQYPLHTERIGQLPRAVEFVFNTPSHHRVHHGSNNPYLDKNYGAIFIVWDRIFGTYAEEAESVAYGLTKKFSTFNPVKANYDEFLNMVNDIRRARTWQGRAGYLLRPPGWRESEATSRPGAVALAARPERYGPVLDAAAGR